MRPAPLLLLILPLLTGAASPTAESAYQGARRFYYALKKDPAQRKLRHNWIAVTSRFEALAARFPKSDRAPDALFTAARTLEELSKISRLDDDLSAAVADYQKLLSSHPRHHLSDDAAVQLAHIYLDRLGRPEDARKVATRALDVGRGDRLAEARALLASLPQEVKRPSIKVVPAKPKEPPTRAKADPRADSASEPAEAEKLEKLEKADEKVAKARLQLVGKRDPEVTLAEQLGLKVRRVVIDPGHGGHDAGAVGKDGAKEKDVALAISKRVAKELSSKGFEVLLTRDDDTFVRLEDRARLANESKGDLFISIHCNSAKNRKLRGVETYTLNTSADRYSIRLAARENASSEKSMSDLQFILADLATKANTDESNRLAERVQKSLVGKLSPKYDGVKDLGKKQALFYVLLGAKMPAILVETSFLSNPEDERRLSSAAYQDSLADAISAGVTEFVGQRERVAQVD